MSRKHGDSPAGSDGGVNRREFDRMKTHFKLSIAIDQSSNGHILITPALVHDISRNGLLIETRQDLSPGQTVAVSIPTEVCPDRMELPRALNGDAQVIHTRRATGHRSTAGLCLGDNLRQLPEFLAFIDYLHATSEPLPA